LLARVDEEIGRLDVAVHDVATMEVGEPGENLAGKIRELRLARDVGALQGPPIHEPQEHLDFAVVVEHVVALDHVGVVHVPEDLDLRADLTAHKVLVGPADDLERVDAVRGAMDHLVDGAAAVAADAVGSIQLREVDGVAGVGVGRQGGGIG
jgi:hypothetical protein